MKNYFLYFIVALFLLVSSPIANANNAILGGGDLVIWNVKTGNSIGSIKLPDEYFNKDLTLIMPLEITLTKEGKAPIILPQSNSPYVSFPSNLSGVYTIQASIGEFTFIKDVQF